MLEEIEKELKELENKESNIPNMMNLSGYKEKKSDISEFSKIHFKNENLEKSFEEEKKILDSLRNSKKSPINLENFKEDNFKDFPVNDKKKKLINDLDISKKNLKNNNLLNLKDKIKNKTTLILRKTKKNFKIYPTEEKRKNEDKPIREDKILKNKIIKKFGRKSYDSEILNIDKLNLQNFSKKMKLDNFVELKDNDFLPKVVSYSIIIVLVIMIIFQ